MTSSHTSKRLRFSVIIPCYNEAAYIRQCLESVEAQTRQPDEIIVIDNNSTDETATIAATFSNVKVISENQQGIVFASAAGFKAAKGDVLVKIDADSRVNSDWLAQYELQFADSNVHAASGRIYAYEGSIRWFTAATFNYMTFTANRLVGGHHMLFGSNYAIRKNVWLKIHPLLSQDVTLWEDLDAANAVHSLGFRISHIRQKLVGISVRGADISARQLHKRLAAWPVTYWRFQKISALLIVPMYLFSFAVTVTFKPVAYITYSRLK